MRKANTICIRRWCLNCMKRFLGFLAALGMTAFFMKN